MRKLGTTLAPILLLALACGGEEETARVPQPPLDACQLFQPEDAKAVLKATPGLMQSVAEDELGRDLTVCAYSTGRIPPDIASLKLHRYDSAERAERALRAVASTLDGEEVPALG
ncbi:MAG: hypothetical protein ACRD2Z_13420, partial [Thermoanaerobaculia bacterium]